MDLYQRQGNWFRVVKLVVCASIIILFMKLFDEYLFTSNWLSIHQVQVRNHCFVSSRQESFDDSDPTLIQVDHNPHWAFMIALACVCTCVCAISVLHV